MVGKDDIEVGDCLLDDLGLWKVIHKSETTYSICLQEWFFPYNEDSIVESPYNRHDDTVIGNVELLDILMGLE